MDRSGKGPSEEGYLLEPTEAENGRAVTGNPTGLCPKQKSLQVRVRTFLNAGRNPLAAAGSSGTPHTRYLRVPTAPHRSASDHDRPPNDVRFIWLRGST